MVNHNIDATNVGVQFTGKPSTKIAGIVTTSATPRL
jgi:hypothetical protein